MITWRLPELVVLLDVFAFTQNPLTGINIYVDMLQITYRFAIPAIQMPENHERSRMCRKYVTTTAEKRSPARG